MADPIVHLSAGVPDSGTGNITTLGQTLLDGANITHGAIADAAVTAGATGSLSAKLRSISRDIVSNIVLAAGANVIGAVTQSGSWLLSAGSAIIGKVGIDQTTPGTTNLVALTAETSKVIGVTRTVGNAGAIMDFAGQNAAQPANSLLVAAEFNTTPTTITNGNASPLQMDNAGNLLVNIKAGGAVGGTSSSVGSAAPATATAIGFSDGTNLQLGVIKAASTAPVAGDRAIVVAISPNSVNANGQATMANSAPVAIASNQATLSVATDTSQIANGVSGTMLTPTKVKISVASATTTTLVALQAAKKLRILSMYLVSTAANTVTFQSHTTTSNNDGGAAFAANGGYVLPFNPIGWFDTTAGEALDMVTSGAGQVSGQLTYVAV